MGVIPFIRDTAKTIVVKEPKKVKKTQNPKESKEVKEAKEIRKTKKSRKHITEKVLFGLLHFFLSFFLSLGITISRNFS